MPDPVPPVRWLDPPEGPAVVLLDQRSLPGDETAVVCRTVDELVDAVRALVVRGAPLLGVAGAYGVALAAARGDHLDTAAAALAGARPTATNLGWAVQRARASYHDAPGGRPEKVAAALACARGVADQDAAASVSMARLGLRFVPPGARVLTHCNTGSLAAGGDGTAFGVIAAAHRAGRLAHLWVDETRPLLQGARLTSYEAVRRGMPHTVLPDGAAASLFARGAVDLVLVGADRVAADGSVANKVGTYMLAVLAHHHRVPFVVVAPTSTVDLETATGDDIVIEQRPAEEVTCFGGQRTTPSGVAAYNPAFDVTPPHLVTALVTERGVVRPGEARGVVSLLGDTENCVKR